MIKLFILPLLLSIFGYPDNCDTSPLASECVKQMPKKFRTLKTFNVMKRNEQGYYECSYVLTKGTKYNLGTCFNSADNLKIEVFNSKRMLVASITSEKKRYSKLAYKCVASGIYYMRFSYDSSNSCGASLLSFATK